MARAPRLEYAGAVYHVINRGNYRRKLFDGKGAAEAFERTLGETADAYGWRVQAYVIMCNHFHLAVETPEPNLSAGMKFLQGTWVNRYNRFRGLVGRPFQGRFKALHVEEGKALAQVAHYIHLNPVRAKVVEVERIGDFRWSSLWWYPRNERPSWLEPATLLEQAGGLEDSPAGWRRYREYLGFVAEEDLKLRNERFGRLSRGWAVGTKEFRLGLVRDLRQRGADLARARLPGGAPGETLLVREDDWEDRLQGVARASKIDLERLGAAKSESAKVLLAAVLKATSGVSNGWLAQRLAMGQPATVSQYVRRLWLRGGDEAAAGRRLIERVRADHAAR